MDMSRTAVAPPSEGAGGRKWVRVGFRVFLKLEIFTDEMFVGKGYSWFKKKIIGDLTRMSSILTALNGRFNGSDQSDRQCQT